MLNENTLDAEPTVRLYNRGQGAFAHGKFRLNGASFLNVPKSVADLWLSQFPDSIIRAGDAEASGEADRQTLAAKTAELEAANRRIVDLEEEVKRQATRSTVSAPIPVTKFQPPNSRMTAQPARKPVHVSPYGTQV